MSELLLLLVLRVYKCTTSIVKTTTFAKALQIFLGQKCCPHTLFHQLVRKVETSSFEEHTATVTATDIVLARCYASLYCPLLHLTLPFPPVVCCACVCDLTLNTIKVCWAEEVIKVSTRAPDSENPHSEMLSTVYTGTLFKYLHRLWC